MTDFKSSRTIVKASTIAGGDASNTHNFSGSIFSHDMAAGAIHDGNSFVGLSTDKQLILTTGGGGGSPPGAPADSVQVNDGGGAFAGDANFTWQAGSQTVFVTASADCGTALMVSGSLTASCNISASAFFGDGTGITGIAAGAAGNPTEIQFNTAGNLDADADLTWDGTTLRVSGTTRLSGTVVATPTLILTGTGPYPASNLDSPYFVTELDKALDSTMICGHAYIGYGGFVGRAAFGHRDANEPDDFAIIQKAGIAGQTANVESCSVSLNAPTLGYLSFAQNSNHMARFSHMNGWATCPSPGFTNSPLIGASSFSIPPAPGSCNRSGFAIGRNYFPSYTLDVSGGMRIGTLNDIQQTWLGSDGEFIPSIHYITGTMEQIGSYDIEGPLAFDGVTLGFHSGSVMSITASAPRGCASFTVENTSSLAFASKVLLYHSGTLLYAFTGSTNSTPPINHFFLDTSVENCAANIAALIRTSASADFVATNDSDVVIVCNITGGVDSNKKQVGVEPSLGSAPVFATVTGSTPGCFGAAPLQCSATFFGGQGTGNAVSTVGNVNIVGGLTILSSTFGPAFGGGGLALLVQDNENASARIGKVDDREKR